MKLLMALILFCATLLSGCSGGDNSNSPAGLLPPEEELPPIVDTYTLFALEWIYNQDLGQWEQFPAPETPITEEEYPDYHQIVRHGVQFELKVIPRWGEYDPENLIDFGEVSELKWTIKLPGQPEQPYDPIRFGENPTFFRIDDTDERAIYTVKGLVSPPPDPFIGGQPPSFEVKRTLKVQNAPPI